jgi:mycofactocin precursor peptide peptidase
MSALPPQQAVPTELDRSVWPEVPAGALVLVPVGSTEQHGPHLPLNTDSVIAHRVATAAAKLLMTERPQRPVLLAPTIAYGASGEHAGFPGTVSIGHEALRLVLVETVRSLALWADRIVFVNGHGGNVPTLVTVVGQLRGEDHEVSWLGCDIPGGDAHAGQTETSLMLYLARDDVRLSAAVAGDTRPLAEIMPELRARGVRAVSPSGVLGDPAGATPEKGRAAFDTMVSAVAHRIAEGRTEPRGRLTGPGGSLRRPVAATPSPPPCS